MTRQQTSVLLFDLRCLWERNQQSQENNSTMALASKLSWNTLSFTGQRYRRSLPGPTARLVARRSSISRSIRAMAAKDSEVVLDKSTPDSKWKEILNAEQVRVVTAGLLCLLICTASHALATFVQHIA